jgi:UDP-N-acetylglucosamine--N-acetylmuramyl-(pentapeptide) pyrophosphoryl-undecaprenol N-acetylglucosamine transferase
MFPLKLADSLWKAKQIIKEFKPDVVIERWFCQRTIIENGQHDGNPTVIQEQNYGITNKLLKKQMQSVWHMKI